MGENGLLIGRGQSAETLRDRLTKVAPRRCPVLIRGESGTGKEVAARFLHRRSDRRDQPFVAVDCTTLRDTLFESQLFGHVRGAFTGADRPSEGFIHAAEHGTLFLDEVGELAPPMQAKLLRLLQEGTYTPLGSTATRHANVRVVAATHRDLTDMVATGRFRQDLFYRLDVVQVTVPALRERPEDLPSLCDHLLARVAELYDEPLKTLTPQARQRLRQHDWPGNIRELANTLEHGHIFAASRVIDLHDLPDSVRHSEPPPPTLDQALQGDAVMPLDDAQRSLVINALSAAEGNQASAARMLQVERRKLYRMVDRYELRELCTAG
jgi:transcriptional regulator with PAS, ATPase and Fis domain